MTYPDKRILIVEDNDMNRMMVGISMSEFEVQTEEASDGSQAYSMFNDKPEGYYDMIFMDIMMPVMDGKEATAKIRDIERLDAMMIPIIAMTAETDPAEIESYSEVGFTEYIEKPMDMDALRNIMDTYLG